MVCMGTLRYVVLAAAFSLAVATAALAPAGGPGHAARSLGATTDPVAVIEPLDDLVSNGTEYLLDGLGSYDLADDLVTVTPTIANYTWEVTHGDRTDVLYGTVVHYTFHELGLYEIMLTVTDSWDNTGVDFTAVMSVDDLDEDGLPDWWELDYLGTMDEGPEDDFDSDGYTNLEEWASGTLPNVADPPPPEEGFIEENWMFMAAGAGVAVAVVLVVYLVTRKGRKEREAKKIKIALELEKSLDEE